MKKLILMAVALMAAASSYAEDYYTEPQVYDLRPRVDREMALDCIGATGIKARVYPGVVLKVEGVIAGAPADGKFKAGDIIVGVNGVALRGINPFVALGKALTRAEATDGKMVFDVRSDEKAAIRKVSVSIPVLGEYSDTWPLNCEKSKKIIKRAAEYYATDPEFRAKYFNDKTENGGIPSALACLFLLSTGDDKYIPSVKEYFAEFPDDVTKIGDHTWNNGYNGIACAEYYLRTGDRDVLPILQYYCDNARDRQCFNSGWQHWGRSINPGYVAGGLMNPAGAQVLTTLLLGKECGVDVDDKTLLGALKFWYRFAGHGTVPYGDHRPEGGLGSNGKDGMAAAAMKIACGSGGDTKNYVSALKSLSMATLTSYPSMIRGHADEGRGDGIWRGIASSYMLDYRPQDYHTAMNRLKWWYDLSRRPSGALGMATCQRFDDVGSGAGVAMAYTAPLKTLRITGAPRSGHAKNFKLPERIWGNDADTVFLSIDHCSEYRKYGEDEPIHVPFYKFGSAYKKAIDLTEVPREEILKYVYHKRYMIRSQAAKALRTIGAFDTLEELLSNKDPRVRRAALDGMCDYRYWFHIGKSPMKASDFTPGMIDAVAKLLKNKKEALWVVDGALMVMSLMSPEAVGEHLDLVMPWTTHDEWWLRQSAFRALATAADNDELLPKVLPVMLDMLEKERHTQPREGMLRQLNRILQKEDAGSTVGQQILAAHMQVVKDREIIPGQRAGEGEYDVGKSAEVILKKAPGRSLELARAMKSRFEELTTGTMTKMANSFIGNMDKMQGEEQAEMKQLLYVDYRQELIKRLKSDRGNLGLLDTVVALTALESPDVGWEELGNKNHAEREWRFMSIEPREDDILHHREKKRFRDIALPADLEKWYEPGFNDSEWRTGKAPIGTGKFEKRKVMFQNKSDWGDGEFLLARTTFEVKSLPYDYYRVSVLANQGFQIYLNGQSIHRYIWWKGDPSYRKIMLDDNHVKLLKKGTNHLAVYAGSEYIGGPHVGQIDVYLQGLRESDLQGRK